MNSMEIAQGLWDRIKQPKHNLEELVVIFQDYKAAVTSISASDPEYKTALHYLAQEWPDLDRLIGKKHDVILKGRLMDAIAKMKKKIADLQVTPETEPEGGEKDYIPDTLLDVAPPKRNIPNLGME